MTHLQGKGFDIELDKRSNILTCRYGATLNAEITAYVYNAGQRLVWDHGIENLRGIIFDFTHVKQMEDNNLQTLRNFSTRINIRMDFSNIPVALIVSNSFQHNLVQTSLKHSSGQHRKRIVRSYEKAHEVIENWHQLTVRA